MRYCDKTIGGTGMSLTGRLLVVACMCLLLGADSPDELPLICSHSWIVQEGDSEAFRKEMDLAGRGYDRNKRVLHLQEALKHRPGHPGNIAIEYYIAVELSQHWNPEHPQPLRREEALKVVEGILKKYRHMDYYSPKKVNSSNDMQMMVPQAAVWGACLERALNRDNAKAREYTLLAMNLINETCRQRVKDWANEPPPVKPSPDNRFRGGMVGVWKWEARMITWRERQEAAATGDVFGPPTMATVKAAVRQFGYAYGPQKPDEVPLAMNEIIRLFPGTPMAKIAEGHIHRAGKMVEEKLVASGMDELMALVPSTETVEETPPAQPEPASPEVAAEAPPVNPPSAAGEPAPQPDRNENDLLLPAAATTAVIILAIIAVALIRRRARPKQS